MNTRELRYKYNLSQQKLSDLTGIPKGRISMWENRNSPPKLNDYNILKTFFDNMEKQMLSKLGDKNDINDLPLNQKTEPLTKYFKDEAEMIGEVHEDESEYYLSGNNQFVDLGNGYFQMLVPLVETYAYAGYLAGFSDLDYLNLLPKIPIFVTKEHRGTYRSFKVKGDSMDDGTRRSIYEGDIAVGRKVDKKYWTSKLHINAWNSFAIVHTEGIIIKSIIEHDVEKGFITCMSFNQDKEFYPNFKLHLSDIYEIYNIVQIIRNNY
ncbi:Transcriptional regulator, contains XRE-family HTH domain [Pseudarcicella hirudinis]|uniref:Transcriptional regulator, contains XRE-family HTH domain n=1 Tax=Pseudarcicella hirudinis TaxID=1079859 RepID=A0A1I5Z3Q6_9BACT|nr:helix-turn-helix transcriptional regulator [Pseudarcicella hirudinis]SFQ50767.1 Transcriptional regulator, contains XRE-family HTH domain [Pseudarcicella hirudinis]